MMLQTQVYMLAGHRDSLGDAWQPDPAGEGEASAIHARILLVEDDAFVQGFVERLLQESGYDVVTASDGAEGLSLALDTAPFDLVITDIRMPVMDGRELGRRLREVRTDLPLLYVSGYDTDIGSLPLPPGGGALGFLRKPFEPAVLLDRIHALLRGR
jgi:DNA-binding response OmpR family regulator